MNRREFIVSLTGGLLAAPLAIKAQPASKVWRIGYLSAVTARNPLDDTFDAAMKQLGYAEGHNLVVERRFVGYGSGADDEVAREIVRLNVDVIVTWAAPLTAAAKRATNGIPIVFVAARAPVEWGLVPSLARPEGNVTGLSTYAVETMVPKLFEIAKELLPRLTRVAVLSSVVDSPGAARAREKAAQAVGVKFVLIPFSDEKDVTNVPAAIDRSNAELLIAPDTPLLYFRRKDIVRFAEKRRLPVVYAFREAVEDGGLMALSTDLHELARRAATYVDSILKGARPGELPVEQPTKLHFVINMKTAKALGLMIPPVMLLRADRVIE